MKIQKSCDAKKELGSMKLVLVPIGTVFRCDIQSRGPYLRTNTGMVDLQTNVFWEGLELPLIDYRPLPNARLVTGEDE